MPTIGYRSSGGLTDSIVDGVTGLLVDDRDGLVDGLERLLTDRVLREQLGAKAAGPQRRILLAAKRGRDAHGAGGRARRHARQRRRLDAARGPSRFGLMHASAGP